MSNPTEEQLTEELIKVKYSCYKLYLEMLDEEYLLYEFYDRFGADPLGHYANSVYAENQCKWIETLLDRMANTLIDDPMLNPVNTQYLSECQVKNK